MEREHPAGGNAKSLVPEMKKANSDSELSDAQGNVSSSGCVHATDSESEAEKARKKNKRIITFKWTSGYEEILEQILIDRFFDFA